MTLFAANSSNTISSAVVVYAPAVLTIEAGVVLLMNASLTIRGGLIAVGTASSIITFQCVHPQAIAGLSLSSSSVFKKT